MGKILDALNALDRAHKEAQYGTSPHRVTDEELIGWDAAADGRKPPKPATIEEVRAALRRINPVKWHNVQSDYRWVQKQMKKMGLNPEDARFIL